ncbi:MAG: tetratricopeptide repeat protein [Terasakiella sp.]|uniref:tetratricopeptide repeat protein n=1 Tax=unclassified Terasakiella TaxID=2614952 RepID=UPI003AFF7F5F
MAEQSLWNEVITTIKNYSDILGAFDSLLAILAILFGIAAWGIVRLFKVFEKKDIKDQAVSELYVLYDDLKKQLENIQDPSDPRFERLRKIQEEIEKRIDDSLVERAVQQGILIEDEADEKRDQAVKELVVHAKDDQQRKALSLIAEGNIDGGLDLLATQAQKASENAETAQHEAINQWRHIGELAYGVDRKRALAAFEKVMELTPHAQAWDYIYLARLYINSAQREDALAIVEQGLTVIDAKERDYFVLLDEKSKLSILVGDREDAHSNLLTVHHYMLARANRDPENTEWQRDLSVSYNKIADVLRDKGKADDALSHYQKSLEIRQNLAKHDPENAEWQRDLLVSYAKLASTPGSGVSWQQAVDQVLAMEKRGILNPVDHWMIKDTQEQLAAEKVAAQ